jgi:hypothetical protein
MAMFIVRRPEVHIQLVLVEADNDDHALALVHGGSGEEVEELEYAFTLDMHEYTWEAYRAEEIVCGSADQRLAPPPQRDAP